ncbi:CaiF/GrlA family transcriptional regulator [Salmonella enterica subsp. enterica]|nr:CaiF/GrlA family transcriptional regulator [Salmonella enterica]EDP9049283.1 CaiF/GrlA family transcriptional regulator [Salmonella enterica subsp. enterica serovar Abony]EEJ0783816.1 CaiF/GrlA family transcriptional regulator [Salmonella enterica]HBJ6378748.1 CaiF/GrlA family transcriptional regulator [Salmonella enterica subsp. enterica serovar Eastbourne]
MTGKIAHDAAGSRDGWSLPQGMADMVEAPLYLAVAVWGLRQERIITMEDICRGFCITRRRAGDILHYIAHEGQRWVTSERHVIIRDNRWRRTGLRILAVTLPDMDKCYPYRRKPVQQPVEKKQTWREERRQTRIKALRIWMVQRRPGEVVPATLLGQFSEQDAV